MKMYAKQAENAKCNITFALQSNITDHIYYKYIYIFNIYKD